MYIALFGGNSSITKSLKPQLTKENEVIVIGRGNSDIIADLNHLDNSFTLPKNLDTIVLSAAHFGGNNLEDYLNAINVNIIGSLKLLDLSINTNVKHFIYISSIYSHIDAQSTLSTIYSVTKKSSEDVLINYAKSKNIKLTIIRPSQIIGNFDSNRKHQPFLYSLLKKIKNSEDVIINGRHNPKRNFIYLDDLSLIICHLISLKLPGVYDCAFPENTSFLEIANLAKDIYKSQSKIYFDETKPDISDNVFEYNLCLYDLIDYRPKTTISQMIEKILI